MTTARPLPLWRRPWFAALVCGLLLLVSVIPPVSHLINALDLRFEKHLNRAAGVTPVFDQMLLFVADEDGRERLLGLVILWIIVQFWREKSRNTRARMLGTLLFIVVITGAFFVLEDFLDDVIERDSPSYVIKPFRNVKQIRHWDLDVKSRRSFPSSEAMILFIAGFTLLRLGRRRGGLAAMGAGMTLPLAKCIVGSSWPTDIYLGSLPMAYLVTALTVDTEFVRMHGYLTEVAAALFDQGGKFWIKGLQMAKEGRQWWTSKSVFHMEVAVKRFAARELPQIMDCDAGPGDGITLTVPLGGLKSVVRIASCGEKKAVLRAYPVSRRLEAEQHQKASLLLEEHGIRAPRVTRFFGNSGKFGAVFIVEEFIDGEILPPNRLGEQEITSAAEEIARLHSVHRDAWGPVGLPRTEDFSNVIYRRAEKHLAQAARILKHETFGFEKHRVEQWLEEWRPSLADEKTFSLIHGKLHRENCMFEKRTHRFCLLDNTTLEWGMAPSDIIQVHQSLCGNEPDLVDRFDKAYLAMLSSSDASRVIHFLPFFKALFHLSQVAKYAKRIHRATRTNYGDASSKAKAQWETLRTIIEETTPNRSV